MSNLSQQQQQKFWSKMIFEQQNQKKFPEKKIFRKKLVKNKIWENLKKNIFFEKQILVGKFFSNFK